MTATISHSHNPRRIPLGSALAGGALLAAAAFGLYSVTDTTSTSDSIRSAAFDATGGAEVASADVVHLTRGVASEAASDGLASADVVHLNRGSVLGTGPQGLDSADVVHLNRGSVPGVSVASELASADVVHLNRGSVSAASDDTEVASADVIHINRGPSVKG